MGFAQESDVVVVVENDVLCFHSDGVRKLELEASFTGDGGVCDEAVPVGGAVQLSFVRARAQHRSTGREVGPVLALQWFHERKRLGGKWVEAPAEEGSLTLTHLPKYAQTVLQVESVHGITISNGQVPSSALGVVFLHQETSTALADVVGLALVVDEVAARPGELGRQSQQLVLLWL